MSEEEVRQRHQQMQRWLMLLSHSAACNNPACASTSCKKFKQLLEHVKSCQLRTTPAGCPMCKKLLALIHAHARHCQTVDCPIPFCNQLRAARRQALARQEQQRRNAYTNMMLSNNNNNRT